MLIDLIRILTPAALLAALLAGCGAPEPVSAPAAQAETSPATALTFTPALPTDPPPPAVEDAAGPVTSAGEAAPTATEAASGPTPYPAAWMALPVVPEVSEAAREIYRRGLAMGSNPHSFSIIGDCQSVLPMFLAAFERPDQYSLGEDYAYLQEMIDWFAGSFYRERYAVGPGCNVAAVHSEIWADPSVCLVGESPLECEFRLHNPSIAIISMETNYPGWDLATYDGYLSGIVEFCIDRGVVPILGTKADNVEGDGSRNALVAEIAGRYGVPLWNFWQAAQALPYHGVKLDEGDSFHLSYAPSFFDEPENLQHGWAVRNLTALQALDAVWCAVREEAG